jgi:hypothetical protein
MDDLRQVNIGIRQLVNKGARVDVHVREKPLQSPSGHIIEPKKIEIKAYREINE